MVIDIKEVRIGNLMYGFFGDVEEVDIEMLIYARDNLDKKLAPITLTEEWLLKLGFIKSERSSESDFGEIYTFSISIIVDDEQSSERITVCLLFNDCEVGEGAETYLMNIPMKYVHQVQNLYHSFTNQELKIKQ